MRRLTCGSPCRLAFLALFDAGLFAAIGAICVERFGWSVTTVTATAAIIAAAAITLRVNKH